MIQDDPVVERVREARRQIWAQCGWDPHRVLEWAKRIEAETPDKIIRYETPQPIGDQPSLEQPNDQGA